MELPKAIAALLPTQQSKKIAQWTLLIAIAGHFLLDYSRPVLPLAQEANWALVQGAALLSIMLLGTFLCLLSVASSYRQAQADADIRGGMRLMDELVDSYRNG